MDELLSILFLSRDVAHREHLRTTSYAKHKALGHFYEDIVPLADSLAEAYQGRNGVIEGVKIMGDKDKDTSIEKQLKSYLDYIERNRYTAIEKDDTALQNIVDEIVGLFLSTLYQLNRFE